MNTRIISLVNHKGGVGKTTTAHNLGKALHLLGKRVLLIDNDPQSNLTTVCGINAPSKSIYTMLCGDGASAVMPLEEGLDIIPSELDYTRAEHQLITEMNGFFKMKKALKPIAPSYDFVLIDCPPSLGIFTSNALIASNSILIVVQSSFLSVKGLQTIIDVIEETKEELNPNLQIEGFLITQANRTVVRKEMETLTREVYAGKVFETTIRQNVALEEAATQQMDIFSYSADSYGAEDYRKLAQEVLG
jgi:chromosome partitioning protein